MDMVIHRDPKMVSSELLVDASIASHARNAGCSGRVHQIRTSDQSVLVKSLLSLLMSGVVSEEFVLTSAATLVTSKVFPMPYANKYGSWSGRSERDTDTMVSTAQRLCEMGSKTLFDFETTAPCKMNSQKAIEVIMQMTGKSFMLRTAYFNILGEKPVRIDDPMLPTWRHGHYPTSPIVSLSEVCMKSEQCKAWVRKIKHNEHTTVPA